MKVLLRTNTFALSTGWHVGNELGGWELACDVVILVRSWARVAVFGWGWDDHVPLRPWPQVWVDSITPKGNLASGVALFGFFLNVGR